MHIDPKAPADSPQHPRNWRKPQFLPPGMHAAVDTTPLLPELPSEPAAPAKAAPKKPAKKARNLADALAKLGDG